MQSNSRKYFARRKSIKYQARSNKTQGRICLPSYEIEIQKKESLFEY